MKRLTRLDWLIFLILAALVALFYWRIITPNAANRQSFPPGDFSAQFWAFAAFEARELSAGRLPLWNPYTFAGSPFWADVQAAVFYPPSLLTLLLSAPWGFSLFALELEAIAHMWLAAVFMYMFGREITRNRAAALVAALTFAFGGYLTGYPSQQLAVLETDVWLPLILFFLHRAGESTNQRISESANQRVNETAGFSSAPLLPRSRAKPPCGAAPPLPREASLWGRSPTPLLLAGAAWGMALLAGHPQSALIAVYVSTAYTLFLWKQNRQSWGAALRAAAIYLGVGLGLAAIQFIPAAEYTLLSVRAAGAYEKMSGGFPLPDLIQILLPGQVSLYSPLYVGVVGLLLAVWVIFAAPNHRFIIFWAAVAGVSLLISFGGNTFLYSPLYLAAPGFSIFRGQERWAFAAAFSMAVLAGYGYRQMANSKWQIAKNGGHSFAPGLLSLTKNLFFFALLLMFLFFYGLNNTGWTPASPFFGLLGAASLLAILLALAWLLWRFGPRSRQPVFAALTAALICFDLFTANWQTNLYPQLPQWHTQIPAVVSAIKQDAAAPGEPFRVYNEFRLYDNYGVPFALEDLWGASPLRPARYDQFLAPPMPIERAWELLNLKYVITWRQELYAPSTIIYQEPAADGVTYVHRLHTVGPRAWAVYRANIADDAAILSALAQTAFDPQQMALLEPGAESALSRLNQPNPPAPASITRVANNAGRVRLHVDMPAPGLLVLSEPHYPGWRAAIDGQSTALLRANYVLQAVPVPAGQHTVELTFLPASFIVGAIISGLTVVGLAVTVLRRRAAPESSTR